MLEKLPPMPAPEKKQSEKKQPGLTDLTQLNKELADKLAEYTESRNYLYSIATGVEGLPMLQIKPFPDALQDTKIPLQATIDMNKLPQDVVESILFLMIGHQESMAFNTWAEIATNALAACKVVEQIKVAQEQQARKQQEEAQFPTIIPFPEKHAEPPSIEAQEPQQEVPRKWPGR